MAKKGKKGLRKASQNCENRSKICPMSRRKVPENEPNQCKIAHCDIESPHLKYIRDHKKNLYAWFSSNFPNYVRFDSQYFLAWLNRKRSYLQSQIHESHFGRLWSHGIIAKVTWPCFIAKYHDLLGVRRSHQSCIKIKREFHFFQDKLF